MISGFNTDVEYKGVTYHVQTEDKGINAPFLLSLVYSKGEILASKRSPYDDLIAAGFNEDTLNERLQRQHKLICAAIKAGRIDDLRRMSMKEAGTQATEKLRLEKVEIAEKAEKPETAPRVEKVPTAEPGVIPVLPSLGNIEPEFSLDLGEEFPVAIERPSAPVFDSRMEGAETIELPISGAVEPLVEGVEIIEYSDGHTEEAILPADAVKIITDFAHQDEGDDRRLRISFLENSSLRSGERATLKVLVAHGVSQTNGLPGAHVVIKVLGSAFRPLIFHTKTGETGTSTVHLQLPQFKSGRAAILLKAMYNGEEAELRQIISQR